jgi:hypothetical protein
MTLFASMRHAMGPDPTSSQSPNRRNQPLRISAAAAAAGEDVMTGRHPSLWKPKFLSLSLSRGLRQVHTRRSRLSDECQGKEKYKTHTKGTRMKMGGKAINVFVSDCHVYKRQRAKKCRVPPPKCLQRFCPSDCVDCCHTVNTTKLIKEKLKGLRLLLGYHQISNWPHSHDDELIQFSHFYF